MKHFKSLVEWLALGAAISSVQIIALHVGGYLAEWQMIWDGHCKIDDAWHSPDVCREHEKSPLRQH